MQARPKRSWSMVLRLSVSYAVVTIALLSLSGGLLYWRLKGSLEVDARNTLTDKISVMRQVLRERPNDREALEEEVQWESTARSQSVYYSRLTRDVGTLVIQSPGAQTLIPGLADCPAPVAEDRPLAEAREYHPIPGKTLLLASAWCPAQRVGENDQTCPTGLFIPSPSISHRSRIFCELTGITSCWS
jgi:hypothetical protein